MKRVKSSSLRGIYLLVPVAVVLALVAANIAQPWQVESVSAEVSGVLWSANHETGDLSQWTQSGGGIFNSGTGTANATTAVSRDGRYSTAMTISNATNQTQAVRLFRWGEPRQTPEAYYSKWLYFPQKYTPGGWWNVEQWKSKLSSTVNDPLWILNVGNRSSGEMYFYLYDWINRKSYAQTAMNVPVGRWFQVEVFYKQATNNTGRVTVWQDGVQIFDVTGVVTKRVGDEIHWSVNNYTDNVNPSTATIYVDEAVISTTRVGSSTSPAPSPTPTATSVPPTPVPSSTPTATSVPPTPVPSSTPIATSVPPTPTATKPGKRWGTLHISYAVKN